MKVAFRSDKVSERGTEVALYDYAHYNETMLGNQSLVVTPTAPEDCEPNALKRFRDRFEVVHYKPSDRLEEDVLAPLGVDVCYVPKSGRNDGVLTRDIRCGVHVVFGHNDPHGHVYAYISEWLARKMAGGAGQWVPYIVHPPADEGSLRHTLGIPDDAIVFGRHGGYTTFDIDWARKAVLQVARRRPDTHFIFLNTEFRPPRFRAMPHNIHFVPVTTDPALRSRFINSCDAMIHARRVGETFGLACAEFSAHGKPVITASSGRDLAHLDILGRSAIPYSSRRELVRILSEFKPDPFASWDVVTEQYAPGRVMQKFKDVFLS